MRCPRPEAWDEQLELGVRSRCLKKPEMLARRRLAAWSQLDEMPLLRKRAHTPKDTLRRR